MILKSLSFLENVAVKYTCLSGPQPFTNLYPVIVESFSILRLAHSQLCHSVWFMLTIMNDLSDLGYVKRNIPLLRPAVISAFTP